MYRSALILGLLVAMLAFSTAASADPSHNVNSPLTFTCDSGESVVINPGTVTNQSHQAFVIDSTSILVINYLALSDGSDTLVLFETAPGLNPQGLETCTTELGGGITLITRGFFTPGV